MGLIAILVIVMMLGFSGAAHVLLSPSSRLPMQWSTNGRVNWTARRSVALLFTPVLTAAVMLSTTVLTASPDERSLALYAISVAALLAHLLHLGLLVYHDRKA